MSGPIRRLRHELANRIGRHKSDMWFAHTRLRLDGQRLEVAARSPFVAKWIESHFVPDLRSVAEHALARPVQIEICVAGSADDHEQMPQRRRSGSSDPFNQEQPGDGRPGQRSDATGRATAEDENRERTRGVDNRGPARAAANPNRRPGPALRRLEDFVVGSSNKLAHSAACRLAQDADGRCISPLFIHGDCGVGKTHLLQGVCRRFLEASPRPADVRYVTGEQFTNEYIAAVRTNTTEAFRQRVRRLELLAIDDVHFLSNKVRTQAEFLYTLDAIDLAGARVVLASDNHPHQVKHFDKALVSRFLSGMVVKVERPDRATRLELIRRVAAMRGLRINDAAAETVAANCVGSVREIEGAITKLAAYRTLLNGDAGHNGQADAEAEIGLVLAHQLFKVQPWQPGQIVRMGAVIDAVCGRLKVVKADLMGSGRHRRVVLARSLVAYLGRELTTHSFPEIAQALGRVNHSTIHTADHRLRQQLARDEMLDLGDDALISLKELIDQLRRQVVEEGRSS